MPQMLAKSQSTLLNPQNSLDSLATSYRPEIDGLRAFAVIAVIINHFNKDILPSGYLGVDIFFVISGFVITSSLYQRPAQTFQDFLSGFYERRVKRLVPALVFFVLVTSLLISLFNPDPGLSLKTGLSSLFGVSNFYLLKQSTDYFSSSTELNVFTHTWSLGVEEQFYLLFPLFAWCSGLVAKTNYWRRNLLVLLGALACSSLVFFLHSYSFNQAAAYFLMPARFWEMAAGSLLFALLYQPTRLGFVLHGFPPALTLGFMVAIMFLPIGFGGPVPTIFVVLLVCSLLASLRQGQFTFNILSHPRVVYIGLISYSLYLWHWGVLSVSRWTIGIYWWSLPVQILLLFAISAFSYHYIETRFRKSHWFSKRWKNLLFGLSILLAASGALIGLMRPLSGKLFAGNRQASFEMTAPPVYGFEGQDTGLIARHCFTRDTDAWTVGHHMNHCLSATTERPLVSFVGDSHSLAMFPMAEHLARDDKFDIFLSSKSACLFSPSGVTQDPKCVAYQSSISELVLQQIRQRRSGSVVVATAYLNQYFPRHAQDGKLSKFLINLKIFATQLGEEGASLIVVAPMPEHQGFTPQLCSKQWFRPFLAKGCSKTEVDSLIRQRTYVVSALDKVAGGSNNLHIFDSFNHFCDSEYCYIKRNNTFLFTDDNHVSRFGIDFFKSDFMHLLNSL